MPRNSGHLPFAVVPRLDKSSAHPSHDRGQALFTKPQGLTHPPKVPFFHPIVGEFSSIRPRLAVDPLPPVGWRWRQYGGWRLRAYRRPNGGGPPLNRAKLAVPAGSWTICPLRVAGVPA